MQKLKKSIFTCYFSRCGIYMTTFITPVLLLALLTPSVVFAASITWDGTTYSSSDTRVGYTNDFLGQGLYPTDKAVGVAPSALLPTGNSVYVGNNTAGNPTFIGNIYGGVGLNDAGTPVKTENNTVVLSGNVSVELDPATANYPTPGRNIGSIYGGLSPSGDSSGNSVLLDAGYSGTVRGTIHGGSTGNFIYYLDSSTTIIGDASRNSVTIHGGALHGSVYGGDALRGSATDNSVTVTAGSINRPVYGGYAVHGAASDNHVSILGGTFSGSVGTNLGGVIYGGVSTTTNVSGNTVNISGGTLNSTIYGGYAGVQSSAGNITNNSVSINSSVGAAVAGGQTAGSGIVSGNKVIVNGGSIAGELGLRADDVNSSLGYAVKASVIGGFSSGNGLVRENSVEITGGILAKDVFGGYAHAASVTQNTITMSGSTAVANENLIGGYSHQGDAIANTVTVSDGAVVSGEVCGGFAVGGKAEGNHVIVNNATVQQGIHGGFTSGSNASQAASGNTVSVFGGSIGGGILGGNASGGAAPTENNIVSIAGGTQFDPSLILWGGNGTSFAGNTLHTRNSGYSLGEIANFEHYTFQLAGAEAGHTVYALANPVQLNDTSVHVTISAAGAPLQGGEVFTLFSKTNGEGTYSADGKQGVLFQHTVAFEKGSGSELNVIIGNLGVGPSATPESVLPGQTQLVGLQLVNASADMLHDIHGLFDASEIEARRESSQPEADANVWHAVPFAGIRGGASRWDTGGSSSMNMNHANMVAGVGARRQGLLAAGFFEAGWGRYDLKQDGVRHGRDEHARNYGAGVLLRAEHAGFYAEAAAHAGIAKTDFNALVNGLHETDYTMRSSYFGAEGLAGYKWQALEGTVDLAARYSWAELKGDTVSVAGHDVKLRSVNSHRIRGGARWNYGGQTITPYLGAHYEYETGGRTSAVSYGVKMRTATIRGGSFVGEAGLHVGDVVRSGYGLDIGVEGYAGNHRGITGKVTLGVAF